MRELFPKRLRGRFARIAAAGHVTGSRGARLVLCALPLVALLLTYSAFSAPGGRRSGPTRPADGLIPPVPQAHRVFAGMTDFELGRLALLGGQPARAFRVFRALWAAPDRQIPADCAAFYAGLCAEAMRDPSSAEAWYQRAESLAEEGRETPARARYFRIARAALLSMRGPTLLASNDPALVPTGPTARRSNEADLRRAYEEAYEELGKAKLQYEKDKENLANRISKMSYLLLAGEILSDGHFHRHATANRDFEEGEQLFDEVKTAVEEMQSKKAAMGTTPFDELLRDQPEIAMRYDLVRVRFARIQSRRQATADELEKRLKTLQSLVLTYSEAAEGMTRSLHAMFLDDFATSSQQAELAVSKIGEIAGEFDKRWVQDNCLLAKEPIAPDPDKDEEKRQRFRPYSDAAFSRLHAIRGLSALELARQAKRDEARIQRLAEARAAAEASTKRDETNPVGHYLLGWAKEEQAVEQTRLKPARGRQAAQALLGEARDDFRRAEQLIGPDRGAKQVDRPRGGIGRFELASLGGLPAGLVRRAVHAPDPAPEAVPAGVSERIKAHLQDLGEPSSYLGRAAELTRDGRPADAFKELRKGLERSATAEKEPVGPLWAAYVEAGLRAGVDREALRRDLQEASEARIFPKDDYLPPFLKAKIDVVDALDRMAGLAGAKPDAAGRKELRGRLREVAKGLEAAEALCTNMPAVQEKEVALARCRAYLALAIVLPSVLDDDPNYRPGPAELKAQSMARNALKALDEAIARNGNDRFDLADARVASLMAYGHAHALLEKHLPEEGQDQALPGFSLAIDALAELPYRTSSVKLIGSPLVTTILGRPENKAAVGARMDRRSLHAMTYFVDGAISLYLKNPASASSQMDRGIASLRSDTDDGATRRTFEAADLVAEAGPGSIAQMRRTLEAYRTLSLVEADRAGEALVAMVRAVRPGSIAEPAGAEVARRLERGTIEAAVASISSPLEGYALSRALEAEAVALGSRDRDRRIDLLRAASRAVIATQEQLSGPDLRGRYPGLVLLTKEANDRIRTPAHFVDLAAEYRAASRLFEAEKAVDDGLKRHPSFSALWKLKMEMATSRAEAFGEGDPRYDRELLSILEVWDAEAAAQGYERYFWEGRVRERLGEWDKALAAYRRADRLGHADPELKARIGASLALAMARAPKSSQ